MNFDEYVDGLKPQSLAIYVGAGISFNSNIPTVVPLTRYILKKLEIRDDLIEIYLKRGYPFEGFVESLKFYLKDIDPILETFNVQHPTSNHFFIAELIKKGFVDSVYTTNFDLNIELACKEVGLEEGIDFKVFYDPSRFKAIQLDKPICKIFKLHGSIQNKSDLAVTLENIANKRYPVELERIIDYLFNGGRHTHVLYMGYSFSDKFDIQPLMYNLKSASKHVTIVEHSREEFPGIAIMSPPFDKCLSARRVFINTDRFVDEVGQRIFGKSLSARVDKFDSSVWQRQVDDWLAKSLTGKGLQNAISIAVELFARIDERQISSEFIDKGLKLLDSGFKDNKFACDMLARRAGFINPDNADEENLRIFCKCLQGAIEFARLDHSVDDEMTHLGSLAAGYCHLYLRLKGRGETEQADSYKKQSLALTAGVVEFYRKHGKDFDKGVEKYFGYKMNLALLNRKLNELAVALKINEEILTETSQMHGSGIAFIRSSAYFNVGFIAELKGDIDVAITNYKESLSIARDMGLKERVYYAFQHAISLIDKKFGRNAAQEFLDLYKDLLERFDIKFDPT